MVEEHGFDCEHKTVEEFVRQTAEDGKGAALTAIGLLKSKSAYVGKPVIVLPTRDGSVLRRNEGLLVGISYNKVSPEVIEICERFRKEVDAALKEMQGGSA